MHTNRQDIIVNRLKRRIARRDEKIAGLESKIKKLEEALAWRTLDLETLSRNLQHEVQQALCNVRMIPVFGGRRDRVIAEVKTTSCTPTDDR